MDRIQINIYCHISTSLKLQNFKNYVSYNFEEIPNILVDVLLELKDLQTTAKYFFTIATQNHVYVDLTIKLKN